METQTSELKTTCCNLDQNAYDSANALIALFFGLTGFIYLLSGDWKEAPIWFCLSASCVLAIGLPYRRCDWKDIKTTRALASIACCVLAIALLVFTPPHHKKFPAEASAKPSATSPNTK